MKKSVIKNRKENDLLSPAEALADYGFTRQALSELRLLGRIRADKKIPGGPFMYTRGELVRYLRSRSETRIQHGLPVPRREQWERVTEY